MEASIFLSSSSRQKGSSRIHWNTVSQFEWESPTARATTTRTSQCLPAEEAEIKLTHYQWLIFIYFCVLLLYTLIRLDALLSIYNASQALTSAGVPLYNLHNLIWTMNLYYDALFALFELMTIVCLRHVCGTVFFTLHRFVHFAINLKQAIQPEIPENSLVRKELSHINSLDYTCFHLHFNFLLCYLLIDLLYTQIYNRLENKSNTQPATPTTTTPNNSTVSSNEQPPKRNLLNRFLIVTFIIFFIIRLYTFVVLIGASETLKSLCVPEEHLHERLRINQAWGINVQFDYFLSLIEVPTVPFRESLNCTIFFTILRFVHLAVNLKQVIHPELPEDAWLRQQYSGLYSPFYVCLHLFFNLLLSCLLPLYIFQLYRRPKVQTSKPPPAGINSA